MEPPKYSKLLFIQSKLSPSFETEQLSEKKSHTSWQKHASHEYHRRVKLRSTPRVKHSRKKLERSERGVAWKSPLDSCKRDMTDGGHTFVNQVIFPPTTNVASISNWDPFGTVVSSDVSQYTREMLFHAITQQWKIFTSIKPTANTDDTSHTVLSYSMSSKATLNTIIFAAVTHWSWLRTGIEPSDKTKSLRLTYRGRALEELRKEIADLKTQASEQLLMTMVTLAAQGTGFLVAPTIRDRSRISPLSKAQDFGYYGITDWEVMHLVAVKQLVDARGGLSSVQSPGLANAISLADIFRATRDVRAPFFDLEVPTDTVMSSWPERTHHNPLLDHLGTGFEVLPGFFVGGPLMKVLEYLHQLLLGFDMYLSKKPTAPTLVQLVGARNAVQHALMSLDAKVSWCNPAYMHHTSAESATDFDHENQNIMNQIIYDLVRYAAIAFSFLVSFPIPRHTGHHQLLIEHLKRTIEQCDTLYLPLLYQDLLLWATMTGGVLAEDCERSFFAKRIILAEVTSPTGSNLLKPPKDGSRRDKRAWWEKIEDLCFTFLWYDKFDMEWEVEALWIRVLKEMEGDDLQP